MVSSRFEAAIAILKGILDHQTEYPEIMGTKNELAQSLLEAGHISDKQGDPDRAVAMLKLIPEGTDAHAPSQEVLANWTDSAAIN